MNRNKLYNDLDMITSLFKTKGNSRGGNTQSMNTPDYKQKTITFVNTEGDSGIREEMDIFYTIEGDVLNMAWNKNQVVTHNIMKAIYDAFDEQFSLNFIKAEEEVCYAIKRTCTLNAIPKFMTNTFHEFEVGSSGHNVPKIHSEYQPFIIKYLDGTIIHSPYASGGPLQAPFEIIDNKMYVYHHPGDPLFSLRYEAAKVYYDLMRTILSHKIKHVPSTVIGFNKERCPFTGNVIYSQPSKGHDKYEFVPAALTTVGYIATQVLAIHHGVTT